MKEKIGLLIILFLFFLFHSFAKKPDPNLELIKYSGGSDIYPGSEVVVLYDSTDVDVKETGLSYVTMHKLTKILNINGAKNNRQLTLNYDPLSAKVSIMFVRIYKKDSTIETIDVNKALDYPAPARAIYWGSRNLTLEIGRLEPGDVIETIVFRKGFTYALLYDGNDNTPISKGDDMYIPPMKGHFYDIVEFWSGVPINEKVYKITIPEDKPLQYEVYNGEVGSSVHFGAKINKKIDVVTNPHVATISNTELNSGNQYFDSSKIGKTIYCWYKKNIMPFKGEPNMVSPSDVATKLLVSTSPDWYAKGVWFNKVNEDYGSFVPPLDVKALTDSLLKGVKDEMEKISILTHWAAEEIRYSGISMGEGEGYTLHKGSMTFLDRCGVCKDKAGMLITLLRAAGFESYPAMTMAGSRIDKIPSDQFNHSVSLAKLSNGKWILLDPTWVPQVRELWSSAEQQQEFLMGIPGGADLKTSPLSPPENHYLKMKNNADLKADGTLEGTVSIEAEGQTDATIRRLYNSYFETHREEYLPSVFANLSPKAEVLEQKYSDPMDLSSPYKISVKYRIPDYAILTKDKLILLPLLAKNPFNDYYFASELLTDTSLQQRQYGFRVRCSKLVEIDETISLPSFEEVQKLPEFTQINGQYAGFEAKYSISKNKLHLTAKHVIGKRIFDAKDWPDFRSALVERMKLMGEEIVLKR